MKQHLHHHIAQLLFQKLGVLGVDALTGLVDLLNEVAADGVMVLYHVPGAAPGVAEDGNDLPKVIHIIMLFPRIGYHSQYVPPDLI